MEMEERIRSHDWSRTPLGPVESWSPALRMMVRFLVANRFPLLLWWGPQYTCIYNDAYQPILGVKHPRALGAPVDEVWSEIWDVLQPLIDTPYHGGPATWNEDLEVDLQRHGFVEETHFTIAYSPVPDESVPGGIGGVLAAVHEITEKVIAERRTVALRELGARLGVAKTADEACRIAAETLVGHAKDVPFALIYLVEDERRTRLAGAAGASAPPASWPLGDAHLAPARLPGSDAPAVAVTIPSRRPDEPAGVMVLGLSARLAFDVYYRDFIELACTQVATALANARAYEEERRRAEALAAIDRAKTAFFSNVSHEFRTPLTLMLGPLEDALGQTDGALRGDSLDTAYRNALRLLKLVNSLLDFARIEAGRMQASFVAVDLAAVTCETASMFRSAFDAAGLALTIDCELAEPVFVDRELWEKVLLNLLSNALKFTFAGEVAVRLRRDGNRAVLTVRDSGVGVPAHELPRLFERFHRIEGTRSRTHEGSGIGLALVRELVELHGGEITVASAPDLGTTFTIALRFGTAHLPADHTGAAATLPSTHTAVAAYVQEADGWRAQPDTAAAPPADPATRVLVVDDNADMRGYIARLLRERWTVDVAPDGATGLAMIRERRPALVITDVMMPGIDGFALVRALRDDPATRAIPVIMLSARAGEESRVDGLEAGADDYLIKPFSAKELITRVATQLDLRRLRHQLATEHAALASVFAQAPMPVAILHGSDLVYEFANPAYVQAVGGVVGQRFADVFPAMANNVFVDIVREVLRTGEPQVRNEAQAVRDGQPLEVYFTYLCAPLPQDRVIVIAQDITSQVAASRAKDDFLAMLGHELRNPLAPMLTALQLMRLRGQDSKEQDVLERQVGHLSRLVDDLLDVSRITRGKIDLRRRPIELLDVVMRAIELASPLIEQRRNHLDVRLPRTGLGIDADPERLAQVVANLLTNAAKYSNPSTPIIVSGGRTNGHVELRVRDAGSGIAPEMLERVFDLFVQQRQTLSRARGGLGIGLSIARNLVELHGGTIRAHSEGLGRGSEFVIELPALAIPIAAVPPQNDALLRTREQRPLGSRILLVDDNDDVVTTLRSALQSLGYTVETAHDGPSAIEKARAFAPHIAVLDIGLPVMDGYELAKRLRQEPGRDDLRLIAVTGYGQETDRRRAREAGFARHLVKPVDLVVLASIVKELHARS